MPNSNLLNNNTDFRPLSLKFTQKYIAMGLELYGNSIDSHVVFSNNDVCFAVTGLFQSDPVNVPKFLSDIERFAADNYLDRIYIDMYSNGDFEDILRNHGYVADQSNNSNDDDEDDFVYYKQLYPNNRRKPLEGTYNFSAFSGDGCSTRIFYEEHPFYVDGMVNPVFVIFVGSYGLCVQEFNMNDSLNWEEIFADIAILNSRYKDVHVSVYDQKFIDLAIKYEINIK